MQYINIRIAKEDKQSLDEIKREMSFQQNKNLTISEVIKTLIEKYKQK